MKDNNLFSTLAYSWLDCIHDSISSNTYAIYNGYIKNYILPYLMVDDKEQTVSEVNQNIGSYIDNIKEKEREELIKKFFPVFSMILDYAVEQGNINFNYARVIKPFSKDDGLAYSDVGLDEMAAILSQATHDEMLLDFVLIIDCGLSRGELLGLKWSDINFEKKTVEINRMVVARNGSTNIATVDKKRIIPIMDITVELLKAQQQDQDSFIIPSPSSKTTPFNPSAYRKKIDRVIKKALNGESVTIEILGYLLSIIKNSVENDGKNRIERKEILGLAIEKSKNISAKESKYRRPGTGYVHQLGPNCWQGRYTPTVEGRRITRNVYAATEAECEKALAQLIKNMNIESKKI